ncbi:MAG: glycosyl transferase [Bacteroidales bacterium]|nr:glycosyl transferase [Bacteroidales bacterium]
MSNFSSRERMVARLLSGSPKAKKYLKRLYVLFNYALYKKNFSSRVYLKNASLNIVPSDNTEDETFFGYYDKSPDNSKNQVIINRASSSTSKTPDAVHPISIDVVNLATGEVEHVADSSAYNWQQGSRAQWLDESQLIYNYYDSTDQRYKSAVYDISLHAVTRRFTYPVQDTYSNKYALAINYQRIMALRPDYGYRCAPAVSEEELKIIKDDGIWQIDLNTGEVKLLVSLEKILETEPKPIFSSSLHKVNHVMISPNGKKFIFIHRWYEKGRRHDRLMLGDLNGKLKVLADDDMVSHLTWVNDELIFGYLRNNGKNGFYFINTDTGLFNLNETLTNRIGGDGHPSVHEDNIVIDTYPDRSGMQHLYLYNRSADKIRGLIEVRHSPRFNGESRCDLHPRFSTNGKMIFFDTVCSGKRRLCYIHL